jgi:hypothetical protein
VVLDAWKLYMPLPRPDHHRLDHLADDPQERKDRAGDQPDRVAHLRALLTALDQGSAPPAERAPLTSDQAAALRALGYTD